MTGDYQINMAEIQVQEEGWDPIYVEVDGLVQKLYLASPHWFSAGDRTDIGMDIPWGGRVYLSETPLVSPDSIFKPKLLNGYMTYDVDLSKISCGCVAALYISLLPGKNSSGDHEPSGDNLYYCDASAVDGNFCPEFDIMEANKYSWKSTHHACVDPVNGHYTNCDGSG